MVNQRSCGRLAVGSGNPHNTVRRQKRPRHREQLDIPYQRHAIGARLVGNGVAVDRNAGRNDDTVITRQIGFKRIGYRCDIRNSLSCLLAIVPRQNLRAARRKRPRCRQA